MANLRVDKITSTETFETTGSVQFDGSGDYLSIPTSDDFAFGTGDFTIEFFICLTSTQDCHFYEGRDDTNSDRPLIRLSSSSIRYYADGGDRIIGPTLDISRWYHIAVSRSNGVSKLFVDGVSKGTNADSITYLKPTSTLFIATNESANNRFVDGFMSNLRVVKGKALYTANFKPPMRELEVTPETVLLACQSKTDTTLEKTGKTLTVGGNAVASELTPGILTPVPKAGAGSAITGSVEFDGTGDYLSLADSSDWHYGSGDFTAECWVQPNASPSQPMLVGQWSGSTGGTTLSWVMMLSNDSNRYLRGLISSNTSAVDFDLVSSASLVLQQWNHCAFVKNGSTFTLYLNGINVASTTDSDALSNATNALTIGATSSGAQPFQGFISNVRVVKGTALYTSDFIPPTRELKKVPGTVLLCCQDPDNPLTEATGKTITGYGDLQTADGVELVSNGTFDTNTTGWTAGNSATLSVDSNRLKVTNGTSSAGWAAQEITVTVGKTYVVSVDGISGTSAPNVRIGTSANNSSYVADPGGADGKRRYFITATSSSLYMTLKPNSNTNGNNALFDNASVTLYDPPNKASNFTPQVGDDRKVTFEGVTKVNSDAYFYLPTGDTVTRKSRSGRGLFGGAMSPSFNDTIDLINIPSMGNAVDFGDIFTGRYTGACSSSTRAVFGGGEDPSGVTNVMDFVTIATNSDAINFGDLTTERRQSAGCSSQTRGLFGGGSTPTNVDTIDYITIASTGDATDFGNLTVARRGVMSCSSPVRGVWGGGIGPGSTFDVIDYVTIASTGNAIDFGNLTTDRRNIASGGCSNQVRGVFAGGRRVPANANSDVIDYITIASTGNAIDFGNLSETKAGVGACSTLIRGVFAGGYTPTILNTLEYITIASTGDAKDFGDLTIAAHSRAGCSDSHGGLG